MGEAIRRAYRNLRSAPMFWLAATVSLSIGIGGNLAMFTAINDVILRPLPFPGSGRLVLITQANNYSTRYNSSTGLAPVEFIRRRDDNQCFSSFSVIDGREKMNLTGPGIPETLGTLRISANFFETLGVTPQRGRWFLRGEEKRGSRNVVIISDGLWRSRFAADPEMIGRKIILDNAPYEVVGITPPDLRAFRSRELHPLIELPLRTDVFVPIRFTEADEMGRPMVIYLGIARLKPGVSAAGAAAELTSKLPEIQFQSLGTARTVTTLLPGIHDIVEPLQNVVSGDVRKGLLLLLLAVGLVLLISCVNVANLSLVRAARRARERAIRVALGARKRDLIVSSLAESLILTLSATVLGAILASWAIAVMVSAAASQVPRLEEAAPDTRVFLFTVVVSAVATLLCGVLPAWKASDAVPEGLMTAGRAVTETRRSGRIHRTLVAAEVALATVLAIGSGLVLISLHRVLKMPTGFDSEAVSLVNISLPRPKYATIGQLNSFLDRANLGIAAIPGVSGVAGSTATPFNAAGSMGPMFREGAQIGEVGSAGLFSRASVSADYFRTMSIPLRAGRPFRDGEPEAVAVVSQSAARALWSGDDPIGRRITNDDIPRKWLRVIGVVGDVLSEGLDRPFAPAVYRPFWQNGKNQFAIAVRSALTPEALAKEVRAAVWRVDPEIPVPDVRPLPTLVSQSAQQRRLQATLLAGFAWIAVLLAAVGIYGVVAYSVARAGTGNSACGWRWVPIRRIFGGWFFGRPWRRSSPAWVSASPRASVSQRGCRRCYFMSAR